MEKVDTLNMETNVNQYEVVQTGKVHKVHDLEDKLNKFDEISQIYFLCYKDVVVIDIILHLIVV